QVSAGLDSFVGIGTEGSQDIAAANLTIQATAADANAQAYAGGVQSINIAGDIQLEAMAAGNAGIRAFGSQTIDGGTLTVEATAADAEAVIYGESDQTVTVAGDIRLAATAANGLALIFNDVAAQVIESTGGAIELTATALDAVAGIGSPADQTITSAGATNLTGTNGGRAVLVAEIGRASCRERKYNSGVGVVEMHRQDYTRFRCR